jgi:hypothetical protein
VPSTLPIPARTPYKQEELQLRKREIMATYNIDTYHVRLGSSRPTTELNPDIAVAGIFLYEGGQFRGYAYF